MNKIHDKYDKKDKEGQIQNKIFDLILSLDDVSDTKNFKEYTMKIERFSAEIEIKVKKNY